jgi:hypothetical protein
VSGRDDLLGLPTRRLADIAGRSGLRGGLGEGGVEPAVVESSKEGRRFAVGSDDHERRLGRNAEVLVQVTVAVDELLEGELMTVDKPVERRIVAGPGDPIRDDLLVPVLGDQFDRTGFGVADRSSRRPEPQHHRPPLERRSIQLTTTEYRRRERERRRRRSRRCGA